MNAEFQQETTIRDMELPGACVGCGGPIAARFSPGGAHGVCLACHLVTELGLARSADGVQIIQVPGGVA
jgi:hypothetical protein